MTGAPGVGGSVVREPAPAKLNLFLRVLRRRPDGFHDIETLVQPLTLADGVEAAARDAGVVLLVAGAHAAGVPRDGENLVLRAARALAAAADIRAGARLLVVKNVPVAAGLGGGSADAAAALRALNDLWGCGLGPEDLAEVAAGVGSDVPALVDGGPVLARGRGERVEPGAAPRTWWALVTLPFGVSAADAYRWWDEEGEERSGDGAPSLPPDADADALAPMLRNDLEPAVAARHPEVGEAGDRLLDAGAVAAIMCGSGPTVAGLCRDGRHAEEVAATSGGMVAASVHRG